MPIESVPTASTPDRASISAQRIAIVLGGVLLGAGVALALVETKSTVSIQLIATLLTAGAALMGVVVTNAAHEARQLQQLAHDRHLQGEQLEHDRNLQGLQLSTDQQSERLQREIDYKKVLYVDAGAAVEQVVATFIDYRDPELVAVTIGSELRAQCLAIAKLSVVSDDGTLSASQAFITAVYAAILPHMQKHGHIKETWTKMLAAQGDEQSFDELAEAFDLLMTQYIPLFETDLNPVVYASVVLKKSLRRELRAFVSALEAR